MSVSIFWLNYNNAIHWSNGTWALILMRLLSAASIKPKTIYNRIGMEKSNEAKPDEMVIYLVMMQQLTIDTKDNRHKKYTIPQTQHFGDPFRSRLLSSVRKMNELLKTDLKFKFNTCQESTVMNYSKMQHDLSIFGTFFS